ncbi:DUF2147 domain-containing protein [Microvirga puerhi]|uniref:DUF2147 domain-containing protein n=1 Tax=Microvirga puerhi TaxID=2876078 RepID=A0ABS7VTH3_9HYPH|nr:DUF2147 domain-containing protein [Microvirga puerhi]MBZ6078868.1 DUF2147 domain-containing protein [Microvirga puerhi]
MLKSVFGFNSSEDCPSITKSFAIWGGQAALLLGMALTSAGAATPIREITGIWMPEDGESAIEISACGSARCGRVVWLKSSHDESGRPVLDDNNPDTSLRSRRICNLQIITAIKPQTDGTWGQGRIYDPEDGRSYDVEVRLDQPDVLKVTGYLGIKTFGETVTWRRTAAPGRCDER